jgi:hypothetical protein
MREQGHSDVSRPHEHAMMEGACGGHGCACKQSVRTRMQDLDGHSGAGASRFKDAEATKSGGREERREKGRTLICMTYRSIVIGLIDLLFGSSIPSLQPNTKSELLHPYNQTLEWNHLVPRTSSILLCSPTKCTLMCKVRGYLKLCFIMAYLGNLI